MRIERLTPSMLAGPDSKGLMRAYKKVFEGPPWLEKWPLPKVEECFGELAKGNAKGLVGFDEDGLIPISFIIVLNKAFTDPIVWDGPYITEFGVIPEQQRRGLGSRLVRNFLAQFSADEPFLIRTINPVVPRIFEKFGNVKCVGRAKDDEYENRFYYRIRNWLLSGGGWGH